MQKAPSPDQPLRVLSAAGSKRPAPETSSGWIVAVFVCLTFALTYPRVFILPHVPAMSWGDQMLFATNGARIVAGQMPYRDYFQFLTPGTDLVYAGLFRSLGVWLWIPNMVMVFLAAIAVLLTMLAARRVLRGASLVLPGLLVMGFGLFGSMDATHHWFSSIVAMTAMLVLMRGVKSRHLVVAGLLCGFALSFTQTKGLTVTAGFVAYLIWKSREREEPTGVGWRRSLQLCGVTLLTFFAINLPFISLVGIDRWFRSVVIFPLVYYPTIPGQTWRTPWAELRGHQSPLKLICIVFVYLAVPLVYLVFFWIMSRRRKLDQSEPWDQLLIIAITGFSMFLAVAPGLTLMRLSSASLPGLILLAWLISRGKRPVKIAGGLIGALSLAIALYLPIEEQRLHWSYLDLPAGRTAILDPSRFELFRLMAERTHPSLAYFGIAYISLPLRLACPAPIEAPGPWEYYRPEQIAASIDAVERNRIPLLVMPNYLNFAGSAGYEPGRLKDIQTYVRRHYVFVRSFPNQMLSYEVWVRKDLPAVD